jgi:hypothetical protein
MIFFLDQTAIAPLIALTSLAGVATKLSPINGIKYEIAFRTEIDGNDW